MHPDPASCALALLGSTRWKIPRHLARISDALLDLTDPAHPMTRLVVSAPPRHGKSELISRWLPVWLLNLWPDRRIILCAYGADFAAEWGDKALRSTQDGVERGLLATPLRPDRASGVRWETLSGGYMQTAGVGGPITGKGADVLIIDDPIKNSEEARSETTREGQWRWWATTASSRLEPGGVVVVTMTRWHEDDLVGRLLEQDSEDWHELRLPAIAEEDDPLGRLEGEALWPERYPREVLERRRKGTPPMDWAALYQQRPQPEGGVVFRREHFKYFRILPDYYELFEPDGVKRLVPKSECWIAQTVDTAQKVKTVNDWTVVLTFVVGPKFLGFLHVARDRVEVPDQYAWVRAKKRPMGAWFQAVEDKGSGIGLIQQAQADGDPFRILTADRDKIVRSGALAVAYQNGQVYHRAGESWLEPFERELLGFPNAKWDDQVDCASYAGQLRLEIGHNRVALPEDVDEDERRGGWEEELELAYGRREPW